MLENDLQSRTELTSMSYAAEVFLRMVNLYRGTYYRLRNAGRSSPMKSRFQGQSFARRSTICRRADILRCGP